MKKYIKKFFVFTTLTAMFFPTSVYGYEKKSVSLNVDDLLKPVKSNVINKEGYTLVAFRDLSEILDIDIDWNSVKREITAKKGDKKLIINVDTNKAKLNDKYLELPVGVEIVDATTYIPLRFMAETFNMKVDWDSLNQKISIDTGKKDYIYLDDLDISNKNKTLSIEEAIKLAKNINSGIRNLNEALEYIDKLTVKLNEQIIGQNHFEPHIEAVLRNINSLNATVQDSDINKKIIEDSIELGIINSVSNIKIMELNIAVLEETIEINKKNVETLSLRYKYGMISENDLKQAKDNLKNDELNLEVLKNSLKNQRKALNNTLGKDNDTNVNINFDYDFSKLDKIDIESFVTRSKEGDISIQLLKKNVDRLEETKRNYSHSSSEEEKLKVDNDINSAERKLRDAKTGLESKIRNNYNNLLKIRDRDKILKLDLEKAKDDYNKVAINYINGNTTLNKVKQAELSILNVEKQIEQNRINFETAFYSFEKPYLSSGIDV